MPVEAEDEKSRSSIQVIARAAEILRTLAESPGGLTQAELAERLGLARTTVHRIVGALVDEGLLTVSHSRGRYRVGPEIDRMAAGGRRDMLTALHHFLDRISSALQETVDLSVLQGSRVTFVDQVVAPRRLQAVSAVGESFPAHACAPGKALLADLSRPELAAALPPTLSALTPKTVTSLRALRTELAQVRLDGVAFDREEHTSGICAVAVVLDTGLNAMAVSVPMPSQRFYGREEELREAVLAFQKEWQTD